MIQFQVPVGWYLRAARPRCHSANHFPYLEPEHALSRTAERTRRSNFLRACGGLLETFCRLCKHPSCRILQAISLFRTTARGAEYGLCVTPAFSNGAILPSTVILRALPDQGRSDARVPTRLKVDSKELRSAVLTSLYFMQESMLFSNGRSVSLTPGTL